MEVGNEKCVLCNDDRAGIVDVVVVPSDELVAGMGQGVDEECFVGLIEACARYLSEAFVVGYDAGIELVVMDRTSDELYVVTEELVLASAFDGVLLRTGVVVVGVVTDGLIVASLVDVEFISGLAGSVGVVVDGYDEVVGTIVVEL